MGYLSEALKKYYKKDKKRIVFIGGLSLSNLALQMWEALDYQQIDSSVVSRVLNGTRLFTPKQLDVFCSLLNITSSQREYLFVCLSKDYFKRDNIILEYSWEKDSSLDQILYAIEKLTDHAIDLFYEGKSQSVIRQNDIIQSFFENIHPQSLSIAQAQKFYEIYGYYLFLRDRSIAGTYTRQEASRLIRSTATFLESIGKKYNLKNLYAYAQLLHADVWYMNAKHFRKDRQFSQALSFAYNAFSILDITHREKLAALRLMVACSCYVKGEDTIRFAEKALSQMIAKQPIDNVVNAIHASIVLTKGKALLGDNNPFVMEDKVSKYFINAQLPTGAYFQISDIKTRVETFSLFNFRDKTILLPLIESGLKLSENGDYPKHKQFFEKQLRQWSY